MKYLDSFFISGFYQFCVNYREYVVFN